MTALHLSNTVLSWTANILCGLLILAALTAIGLFSWSAVRDWLFRDADTLVPPPANDADWQVWDDEAEAGMPDEQVAMLRQGYVPLAGEQRLIGAVMQQQAADAAAFEALSLDPDQGVPLADRTADIVIDDDTAYPGPVMPPRPPDIGRRIPWQREGGAA